MKNETNLEDLNSQKATENVISKRKIPFIVILIAFLVFMSLGFLLMWFDKTYHRYLRIILFIFGIVLIFLSVYFLITINRLSGLYKDFNVQQPIMFPYAILFFLASLGIIQIALGFFFKRLPDIKIAFASILLVLSSLAFYVWLGTLVSSAVIPLYNLSKSGNGLKVNETATIQTVVVTGVIRTGGLSEEEKQKLISK